MNTDPDDIGRIVVIRHKGRWYDHYGILDGCGNLIHVNKKLGTITKDPLEKALRNATSITYLEDAPETRWNNYIQAESLIGSKHEYKFFTDNCEMWVQKIRTGQAFSRQLDVATNTASTVILAGAGLLAICGII